MKEKYIEIYKNIYTKGLFILIDNKYVSMDDPKIFFEKYTSEFFKLKMKVKIPEKYASN